MVIIVLLSIGLGKSLVREESFVLDFSKIEEMEREIQEQIFKDNISKRIDDMLAAAKKNNQNLKNLAVDAGSKLKDDKNIDSEQLYKEHMELQEKLKNAQSAIEQEKTDDAVDLSDKKDQDKDAKKEEYSGPSVLSYNLDGRKATYLSTPAYKCFGSGDVTVIIKVNRAGEVEDAKILEEVSSNDECIKNYAIKAALASRFNGSATAPAKQTGEILYRFIAQ